MAEPVVQALRIGHFEVMTYVVSCPETREAVLIDPAGEAERLMDLVRRNGLHIRFLLNTHGHPDHVLANRPLKEQWRCPVCLHEEDDDFFARKEIRQEVLREMGLPPPEPADIRLKDADLLRVGSLGIQVIHTPGHTPGSVCFRAGSNLFTGDTLFVGAVGRTDLPGGSLETLLASIEEKLLCLPPETLVWPGHDYGETPTSTLGREMEENPYITDFILCKE